MNLLDIAAAILIAAGCVLALPIYWWLFGAPFVRLWEWWRPQSRGRSASGGRDGRDRGMGAVCVEE